MGGSDPRRSGLGASEHRPRGMATGSGVAADLAPRRLSPLSATKLALLPLG
jgi:hypothetical protein